jgi:hypothetical protein
MNFLKFDRFPCKQQKKSLFSFLIFFVIMLTGTIDGVLAASLQTNQSSLKCIQAQIGHTSISSTDRPQDNGSYTYGLWTFEAKAGHEQKITYNDISVNFVKGSKSPQFYLVGIKISGMAIMSQIAPIEIFSISLKLSSEESDIKYKTGGKLDPQAGGLGFQMIRDGTVEVVILIKDVKLTDIKGFSLLGVDLCSMK